MPKHMGIIQYLESIRKIVLPEPHSQVTKDFVGYVVNAHSWYKAPNVQDSRINLIGFNFFIGPGPLIEAEGSLNERVHEEFQNLKYGVPGTHFDVKGKIPREIYDAGLAIVPGTYRSEDSQRVMVATIANMLGAIQEYRARHPSLLEPPF